MKKTERFNTFIKIIFCLLFFMILIYVAMGEINLPTEWNVANLTCKEFATGWRLVNEDGTTDVVQIPGNVGDGKQTDVTIEGWLPTDLQDGQVLLIYSQRQNLKIYIDGELRQEYNMDDSRYWGKTSPTFYVFVPLKESDRCKPITIESHSVASRAGHFATMYYGDRAAIWFHAFQKYGLEFFLALIMIVVCVLVILGCWGVRISNHLNLAIEYLCWGELLMAIWMLTNSVFRQVIFPNISVISDVSFFMVMLMPIPFSQYLDTLQDKRYHKIYGAVEILALLDFMVCTILQVCGLVDFIVSFPIMGAVLILMFVVVILTILADVMKGKAREYMISIFGFGLGIILASSQIVAYLQSTTDLNLSIAALGLLTVVFIALIDAGKDLVTLEQERSGAVRERRTRDRLMADFSIGLDIPIQKIIKDTSEMEKQQGNPRVKTQLKTLESMQRQLLVFAEDMMDYSQMLDNKLEIKPEEYSVQALFEEIYQTMRYAAEKKGLSMTMELDGELPDLLTGDAKRLRQILINLIQNALEASDSGKVTIKARRGEWKNGWISLDISIRDTGSGEREKDKIRLADINDVQTPQFEGLEVRGNIMSMTLVKQLIARMDGTIYIKSVYLQGSTIYVELPQKIASMQHLGKVRLDSEEHKESKLFADTFAWDKEVAEYVLNLQTAFEMENMALYGKYIEELAAFLEGKGQESLVGQCRNLAKAAASGSSGFVQAFHEKMLSELAVLYKN